LPPTGSITPSGPLALDEVIGSVYASFPLLDSAMLLRDIALGDNLSAQGGFDLKIKGASENGPLGFYKTYRQSLGLVQPLYNGSEIWGGYRIGRGEFQPWYLERQTNGGGEFKAGVSVPLLRNRAIDERRAELWSSELQRDLAEFDIQAQLIGFIQEASYAYWDWVAAGRGYSIANRLLDLAASRTERIRRQVETGLIDPPELTDNLRLVADRRAKLADATRKLQQKAAKLSLYYRDVQGQPVVPTAERLPAFPEPQLIDRNQLSDDVTVALASRPDLRFIDTLWRQVDVDLQQAYNLLQPDVNATMWGSQDVGMPSSFKRDKSPFELEAGLYVDVPMQRRKARGKITALEAKMQQLVAKRRMTENKISVEVQTAYAALLAAFEQVKQTREAVRLAEEMAQRERRNFEVGASDLLKVTLREQYAAESAIKEVDALLEYHQARADYRAALAADAGA
jgi:outer membrane protein TolC